MLDSLWADKRKVCASLSACGRRLGIPSVGSNGVSFRCRDRKQAGRSRVVHLPGEEFLRRLPSCKTGHMVRQRLLSPSEPEFVASS